MSYTIEGKIISIGEVKEFDNGAKAVSYQVETNEQYNNLYSFEMYKGAEYVEHLDKFSQYNKVGDMVNVEFNLKSNHWTKDGNDKIFTSLSCWKVSKVDSNNTEDEEDNLPF